MHHIGLPIKCKMKDHCMSSCRLEQLLILIANYLYSHLPGKINIGDNTCGNPDVSSILVITKLIKCKSYVNSAVN